MKDYTRVSSTTKQKELANHVYSNRMGNGNYASNDGWVYRGRGLKMLTGRYNYKDFTKKYKQVWSDAPQDFEKNPDLLLEMKYAVRSALFFWLRYKLYNIADTGSNGSTVDKITKIINEKTASYGKRRGHFKRITDKKVFKKCC